MARRNPVTAHAEALIAGKVPACVHTRRAGERHMRDLARQRTADFPFYFDLPEALDRIAFFGLLRHFKGEWASQPLTLDPWEAFIVGSLFGWRHVDTKLRRFRHAYNELPRGQGKSTLAAGIGAQLAFFDGEPGAEGYCASTKRDQSRIVFDAICHLLKSSPDLVQKAGLVIGANNIAQLATASKLEPLGADADSTDGLRPNVVIIDEVHAHKSRALYDVLDSATGTRRQPLIFEITTAGLDRTSLCWEHHEYSVKILEGVLVDETWFAYLTGIDEHDDWRDERSWAKANPALGQSVKLDDLRRKAAKAGHMPAAQTEFRRKHLNEWTQVAGRAIVLTAWDASARTVTHEDLRARLEQGAYRGRAAIIGLDLASTQDIAAAAVLIPVEDACYEVIPYFWIPDQRLDDRPLRERLQAWVDQGLIVATDGTTIDYHVIRRDLGLIGDCVPVRVVGFDPWNATGIATELRDDGFTMVEVRQGIPTMGEPTKRLLDLVASGKLRHGGHPVLRWMASNLVVREDANGNLMPDKARSTEKIDGIVATIIALGCALRQPADSEESQASRDFAARGLWV